MCTCVFNRNRFKALLSDMEDKFWDVADYEDEALKKEIGRLTAMLSYISIAFISGAALLCTSFFVCPFLVKEMVLPLTIWMPEGNPSPFFEIMYFFHGYMLYSAVVQVAAFDTFYVAIIVRIVVQFKLLRYELKHLADDGDVDLVRSRLKRCVQHHVLLIE